MFSLIKGIKMSLENKLAEFAAKYNLIYGCGSAEPFDEYRDILSKQVPFVSFAPEERIDPSLALKGAKSLIALGLSYNCRYGEPQGEELCARLSEGAVGEDYHLVMMRLLDELAGILFDNTEEKYLCFCDTGPLSDALVALRCGLGYAGLNRAVINDRFGSMFFIGYIITTAQLQPDPKPKSRCSGCGICIKNCPSGALKANGEFISERCVAYLTQKKGIIPDEFKPFMGTYIYGCDICRRVCPLTPRQAEAKGCAYLWIKELLSLTNKEFNALYGNTAIGWRGRRTIVRNALIALGNIGDKRGIELIKPFLNSENEDLRDAARWAERKMK